MELFENGSNGESEKCDGGIMSKLLCNELWSTNTDSLLHRIHTAAFILDESHYRPTVE